MTDLIWVGNTLLPRWFVFAVVTLLLMVIAGTAAGIVAYVGGSGNHS